MQIVWQTILKPQAFLKQHHIHACTLCVAHFLETVPEEPSTQSVDLLYDQADLKPKLNQDIVNTHHLLPAANRPYCYSYQAL